MKKGIIVTTVLIFGALTACSPIRQAEKIPTMEANNLLESYYETVWNRENNQPGERRQARRDVKEYLKYYNANH